MTQTEIKIAGRGYHGTLPMFEGDGSALAARYYTAFRDAVLSLFAEECAAPHTVCTCNYAVKRDGDAVCVTVILRRRTAGKTTAERAFSQTWLEYPARDAVMKR